MNEREAYIALNMMEGIGPVTVRALVEELGSVEAIFDASAIQLARVSGVGQATADRICRNAREVDVVKEIDSAAETGTRIIAYSESEYPEQLRTIYSPPLALYIRGELRRGDIHSIAVVGTRRVSHYGRYCTEKLSSQLANSGYTIVSGLARGVDTVAHESALAAGGRTIAVMGSGMNHIFPESNSDLAEKIAESGAVLTEFPLGRQPDKTTFPMRNRIVSGLSVGVLVVEAGIKSGAIITANQALEQGRSVFAVPGRIDSSLSKGTHDLIRNGARLVEDAEDILAEYEFLPYAVPMAAHSTKRREPELSADEKKLLDLLADGESDIDTLTRRSGFDAASVGSLLLSLEMKKTVKMLPGRIVELRVV